MINRLRIRGLLSFGPEAEPIEMGRLNVLVGPNGSGKSNFIEALALLAACPSRGRIGEVCRRGGGVSAWMWRGAQDRAEVGVLLDGACVGGTHEVLHGLALSAQDHQVVVEDIEISERRDDADPEFGLRWYWMEDDGPRLRRKSSARGFKFFAQRGDSVLAQVRDPANHPVLTGVADCYGRMAFYRDWTFGPACTLRRTQPTDMPGDALLPDASNLAMVFNELRLKPAIKRRVVEMLSRLGQQFDDYETIVAGGTIQLFLREGDKLFPAVRLSDGTLRYLALLAILLHPSPPPLIVIEEPELGLHPDLMPTLAELLIDASSRTQVVATTHSDLLVDALSEHPEALLVFDKDENGTRIRRLNAEEMRPWLEKFSLGRLWRMGEIGGNRW